MTLRKKVLVKGIVSYSSEFALTITLHPKMYHMAMIMQRNALQGILNSLQEYCKMSMIVEITTSYNIHAHGVIQVPLNHNKSVQHIVHDIFRCIKDIGFICVKPIDDSEGWLDYCLKDYHITNTELIENPVIIDNCGFFSPLSIAQKLINLKKDPNLNEQ